MCRESVREQEELLEAERAAEQEADTSSTEEDVTPEKCASARPFPCWQPRPGGRC